MHVALVNLMTEYYTPRRGGALATCIMQQAKRLIARGHRVSVLTRVLEEDPVYDVGDVIPLDVRERHDLPRWRRAACRLEAKWHRYDQPLYGFYARSLQRTIARLRPDAALAYNDLRAPAIVKRASPDTRSLVRLSNEVSTRGGAAAAADGVLTVSRYIRDWAIRRHGLDPERTAVLHNGGDAASFAVADRRRWSPGRPLRVLFIGRITPDKGVDLALEAVAALRAAGRDVRLTVAGSTWWRDTPPVGDAYFDQVVAAAREIGNPGVTAIGHVARDAVPALFAAHDVVVVPSRWQDPGPQVVFEAMTAGCAVVSTDRGGIPESLEGAGLFFDPDVPGELRRILESFFAEPTQVAQWQECASRAGAWWSWARNVSRLEAVLSGGVAAAGKLPGGLTGETWHEHCKGVELVYT